MLRAVHDRTAPPEAAMRRGKRSRQRERPLRTAGPAYFQNLST